jgi:hypothetical protein
LEIQFVSNEDVALPEKRQNLNRLWYSSGTWKTRNSPVRESKLQGEPMELRAWDNRKSECRFVMKRIRIELKAVTS